MPLEISRLTSLRTLPKVLIGGAGELKISDLKGLVHLQGHLKGLHEVKNPVHAKEANLQRKKHIYDLQMEWIDVFDGSRNGIIDYELLEGLRPFEKLTDLKIIRCTCLPTLGHLPSLQKLFVKSMDGLKRLNFELLGPSNTCHGVAFPLLEVLEFDDMKGWEEWSIRSGNMDGTFPCLCEIFIIDCPKINVVAMELIPLLRVLHVEGCSSLVLRSMVSVSSSIARLTIKNIKGLTRLRGEVLEHLKAVEYLTILHCDELTYFWESVTS
ncbi:putative disease resistance RPP13-like protein 1 [Bidens hawaiensis]|uniref:putative disease resistance RPP13-like protein 1 n=1 Tax=Bidens hawaiensis TaxID=980011 RepID=UPI00404B0BF2